MAAPREEIPGSGFAFYAKKMNAVFAFSGVEQTADSSQKTFGMTVTIF
jgi:hypothetical protein